MEDDLRDLAPPLEGLDDPEAGGPRRRSRLDRHAERNAERLDRHAERNADRRARHAERREQRRAERARRRGGASVTPEERAYREAQRIANQKFKFLVHATTYGAVCLFLLFVAGFRPAFIVAFSWGLFLALHYLTRIIAPGLRQRWIDQEVRRQVSTSASRQRRELRGEHARDLERLSASIAHEIRNPITAAKSLVQQMGEDPDARENVEYAHVALEELDRVERSISHLLRFARDEDVTMGEIRMAEVVDSALETLRERIERLGVRVERELDCDGEMTGDPEKLRRVLINLFSNALDAQQEAATPAPRLQVQAGENLAGSEVWVRVRDNGPGIEPARLERIFSPFHTSRREGTGLGLALSKKVVDAHGGSIQVESEPGAGTTFLLTFPKHPARGGSAS